MGIRAYQVCDDHGDDEVGKDERTDHDAEEEVHSSAVVQGTAIPSVDLHKPVPNRHPPVLRHTDEERKHGVLSRRTRVGALWDAKKVKLFWVNVGYAYLKTAEILGDILTKQINTHNSEHEKEDGQ